MDYKFDFNWNSSGGAGLLTPDDLKFFYYDISLLNHDNMMEACEWDDKLTTFEQEHGLTIEGVSTEIASKEFEKGKIIFSISGDRHKPTELFRHLRNALCHFNIKKIGEWYYFKDFNGDKLTMIGQVKCEDFKKLCFTIMNQYYGIIGSAEGKCNLES